MPKLTEYFVIPSHDIQAFLTIFMAHGAGCSVFIDVRIENDKLYLTVVSSKLHG
jgi:hypothetical protein